jgi:hypothetical protein
MARTPVESRIHTLLLANATVAALVSTRVYPLAAQQASLLPLIVYRRVSTRRVGDLQGESKVEFPRVQIDCQAETYLGAKALASAVLDAMNAATTFDSDPEPEQQEGYEPESGIFTVSLDFTTGNYEE